MVEAQIIEVHVCEEDYKYDLSDWDEHPEEIRNEILRDIDSPTESMVWREYWLVPPDGENYQTADWRIHELMGREVRVIGKVQSTS